MFLKLNLLNIFLRDGWVEHNPEEIWKTTLKVLKEVIKKSKKLKGKVLTIGITNQRETTILWDKKTGKQFTMQLYGKIGDHQNIVKNLLSKKKRLLFTIRLDC